MKIKSTMKITYKSYKNADISYKTLKVDNKGFIKSFKNKNILKFNINSDSLGTFLNTTDDLIASEIVIEKMINTTTRQ